jgi:hypothetical protein
MPDATLIASYQAYTPGLFSPQTAGKIFDLAAKSALLHRSRPAFR